VIVFSLAYLSRPVRKLAGAKNARQLGRAYLDSIAMSDSPISPPPPIIPPAPASTNDLKTRKAAEVAISVGCFCCIVLFVNATWPVALGVAAISASTTVICLRMLA
jgi:hypothetical protein